MDRASTSARAGRPLAGVLVRRATPGNRGRGPYDPSLGYRHLAGSDRLAVEDGSVSTVAFSPEGRRLASVSAGGIVRLWDLARDGVSLVIEPESRGTRRLTNCLAFSPDGRALAIPGPLEGPSLWDLAAGGRLATLAKPPNLVLSLGFSPDGRSLAAGTVGGGVALWDTTTGQLRSVFRGHSGAVWAIAFSPDGRALVSGGNDATLRVWETEPRTVPPP